MKLIRFREAGKEKPGVCVLNRHNYVSEFAQENDEVFLVMME